MRKFMKSKKGFTLVELLIVVVILGILAAVAIPRFVTTKAESQLQACRSNLSAMQSKIEETLFTGYDLAGVLTPIKAADCDTLAEGGIVIANFPNGLPTCPSGGTYSIVAGKVECSKKAAADGGHTI